jgi:hypothetical protein
MRVGLCTLKRSLLGFWAAWLTLALLTNVADACRALGIGPRAWPMASGNYRSVERLKARLAAPAWLGTALFAGVILWQAVAAGLFWRAFFRYAPDTDASEERSTHAYLSGLSLWAAFLVADELFVAHETGAEAAHMRAFTAQLASLMSTHLLPD